MQIPLQQTKNWEIFQKSLGESVIFEENPDFSLLAIVKSLKIGGSYLYLPYGPYLRQKNAAESAYKAIEALGRQKNVTFIRIEPQQPEIVSEWLKRPNVKKSKDLSPAETWILDLTPDLAEIYQNMKQNTRNLCKNYAKKGVSVEISKNPARDIKILADFQKQVGRARNFTAYSEKYLAAEAAQDFATLYLAYFTPNNSLPPESSAKTGAKNPAGRAQKIPVAASLFFDHGDTRYYMQSASDQSYRKLPATYAILNEAIKDAKAKNLKNLDFWGIAPDGADKDHPWAGFTGFKKSFGGREVTYTGTYDIVLKPAQYKLYQLARRGNRFLRRAAR